MTLLESNVIDEVLEQIFEDLLAKIIVFNSNGSGWLLDEIKFLDVSIATYKPLLGSSFIPTPSKLVKKRALINIKNNDNKCFSWSILAALHPAKSNLNNMSNYKKYEHELNMQGLHFPITLKQINKFEKNNNLSINVFGYEKEKIYPLHITSNRDGSASHINLLLLHNNDKSHYVLIKSLNRLLAEYHPSYNKRYVCIYCLRACTSEQVLKNHIEYCKSFGIQRVKLPIEGKNILKFTEHGKKYPPPFVIYADFESLLCKIEGPTNSLNNAFTQKIQKHVPCGYSLVFITPNGVENVVVYRGEDAANHMMQELLKYEEDILKRMKYIKPLQLSIDEEQIFKKALNCHICEQTFEKVDDIKVRDHCHITGKFRGAAHMSCNLNYKIKMFIPVVFHNLKNYDAHIIMSAIGKHAKKINVLALSMEKYLSFQIGHLRFLDSIQFLPSSLDKLVSNLLLSGVDNFKAMHNHFDKKLVEPLLAKGIFPYSYISDFNKFKEEQLPPIECFYNDMTNEHLSENEYKRAQSIWNILNIKNLGEYHDLYVLCDTLLLADVFEAYRKLSLQEDNLDPLNFYSSPSLSWGACLKYTNVSLELLTDPDKYLLFERSLRGGISVISHRYFEANNQYLSTYNPNKEKSYIIYLDCNNLYGYAMSQPLPTDNFKFLTEQEIENFDIKSLTDESSVGAIFEVDLKYPKHLHDLHNDYPLAAESLDITNNMRSPYTQNLGEKLGVSSKPCKKLTPNLMDKTKYVVHYKTLQLYLELGLEIVKIHQILTFNQSRWMEPYIKYNTEKRKQAKTAFEKDYYKIKINALYGKACENIRKRKNIKLITDEKKTLQQIAKPNVISWQIFNKDLAAINSAKVELTLNKPIYVAMSILDISKHVMYDFHYNYIKKKYCQNAKLLFTDTDSLVYGIKTEDIYEDMKHDINLFDFSDYPSNHKCYDTSNRRTLGKFKDELLSQVVTEFVGLKPKMYSLKLKDEEKK